MLCSYCWVTHKGKDEEDQTKYYTNTVSRKRKYADQPRKNLSITWIMALKLLLSIGQYILDYYIACYLHVLYYIFNITEYFNQIYQSIDYLS